MKKAYQLSSLFPYIDTALFSTPTPESTLQELFPKALWFSTENHDIKNKLQEAKIVFIHPDGIDEWKERLLILSKEVQLSICLFIFAGSDFTLGHEHLDSLLSTFPKSLFWVQNWFGYHERVAFLPIGVNGPPTLVAERRKVLGISSFLTYRGYIHREEFSRFVEQTTWIHEYCYPHVNYQEYCMLLSECLFSCCPMGGGYDTFRFWECLMMNTIPIVKSHVFYKALRLQYPKLAFVEIEAWEDLKDLIPSLSPSFYESILQSSDVLPCFEEYWTDQCKSFLTAEKS